MTWGFFYTLVFCSLFNWGSLITYYNLTLKEIDIDYLEYGLDGNEKELINYYQSHNLPIPEYLINNVNSQKEESFLSSQLSYKTINLN